MAQAMLKGPSMNRALRFVVPVVVSTTLVIGPRASQAQTTPTGNITVPTNAVTRMKGFKHPDNVFPYAINYQDCLDDNGYVFTVNFAGALPTNQLQVWTTSAGVDCRTDTERSAATGHCWLVYAEVPTPQSGSTGFNSITVKVRAQEVMAGTTEGVAHQVGTATAAACETGDANTAFNSLVFYFMVPIGGVLQTGGAATWSGTGTTTQLTNKAGYDIGRPPPPANMPSAGVGENRIPLSFSGSTAADRSGYRFYCQPSVGGVTTDGGTAGAAGSGGTSGTGGTSGSGGTLGAGGTAGTASDAGGSDATITALALTADDASTGTDDSGIAGTGGTGGSSESDGSAGTGGETTGSIANAACPAAVLELGLPNEKYLCGSVTGASANSGEATGLENGTTYAVAIATVDRVGNIGRLSKIGCGTPTLVTDFFELYHAEGGKGGGGFCTLGRRGDSGAVVFVLGALAMRLLRRRRAR